MLIDSSLAQFKQVLRELHPSQALGVLDVISRIVLFHHSTSILGYCLGIAAYFNLHIFLLTPSIKMIFSILEPRRHKLFNALDLTFVIPNLCEKVFPTLRPLLTESSLRPLINRATSPKCHSIVSIVLMVP